MKTPEQVSYLLKRRRQDPLARIDDRLSELRNLRDMFELGKISARLHHLQMEAWYRDECRGPRPKEVTRTREDYLMKHLTKQFNRIKQYT